MLLLLLLLSLALVFGDDDRHSKTLLPGIDIMLSGFNIQQSPADLGNSGAGLRIFKIPKPTDKDWNSSCPYYIPDDYLISEEFSCHMVPEINHITHPSDIFTPFKSLCPLFDKMLGIDSQIFRWTSNQIFKEQRVIYKSRAICSLYSVSLKLPHEKEKFPKFEDWYALQVYSLPEELNATTLRIYEDFLNLYGDHVVTRCKRMGGYLGQITSVDKSYVTKYGHSHVE